MALICCSECSRGISDQAAICPGCGAPVAATKAFPASDKERFELGVTMVKAYYDAIETRLAGSLVLFVVVIGWLVASKDTRQLLAAQPWLRSLAGLMLTLVLGMYGWNVWHWLDRWREILATVNDLQYMEPGFYARYKLPWGTWLFYFVPIAGLYLLIMAILMAVGTKWL
jgi:hypothetical protein